MPLALHIRLQKGSFQKSITDFWLGQFWRDSLM